MKITKQLIAIFLTLALVVGMLPATVQAEGAYSAVGSGNPTVEGTNGFGMLLSQDVQEQQEADREQNSHGYNVIGLSIENGAATVEYDSMEEAVLVVALYSEDGMQLLASGNTVVGPEGTEATVTLDGEIPEYFMASAYLLDTFDYSPLCASYDTPLYTKEMQNLLGSTTDDYDQDKILNLDSSKETNFAVYADTTKVIDFVEGVNAVASADDETATYVIENADESFTSLQVGDVVAYTYGEEQILIVKVAVITIDGTTVTITGSELEMEEVFSHVKMEAKGNTSDFTVDDSNLEEGVVFEGLVDSGATYAYGDSTSHNDSFFFGFEDTVGSDNDTVESSVSLTGTLTIKLETTFSYYVSWTKQYIEFKTQSEASISASLTGKGGLKVPLGKMNFSPVPGVEFGFKPELKIEVSASMELTVAWTETVGLFYENQKGFRDLSTSPKTDVDVRVSGKIFIGLDLVPYTNVLGGTIAELKFSAPIGLELAAVYAGSAYEEEDPNASSIHNCRECLKMELAFIFELSAELSFLKHFKLTYTSELEKSKLGDMYYSPVLEKFGWGTCPNQSYRITVRVQDSDKHNVANASVSIGMPGENTQHYLGTTNRSGVAANYFSAGKYTISTIVNGETLEKTVQLKEPCMVTLNQAVAPDRSTIGPDEVTDHGYVTKGGNCGNQAYWALHSSGMLEIWGDGTMENYSSRNRAPWYANRTSIKTVQIDDGITRIGDFTFKDCTNLESITISNSVTNIGSAAFSDCTSLGNIYIPQSVTSIGESAFYGCTGLRNFIIPSSITVIDVNTFYGCSSLSSVYIPNSVTRIGEGAFRDCASLANIIIPDSVISIGVYAFVRCTKLTSIVLPDNITYIEDGLFEYCTSLTNATVGNGITRIPSGTFANCTKLTSVTVGSRVANISNWAFNGCSGLKTIYFTGNRPTVNSIAFSGITATAYYPAGNATWCNTPLESYGGNIKWVSYTMEGNNVTAASEEIATATSLEEDAYVPASEEEDGGISTFGFWGGEYETEVTETYIQKTATFSGLVPGEQYALLSMVSIETEDLVAPENLLYIDQNVAAEDGTLVFTYVQRVDTDMSYVVASGATHNDLKNATITFPDMYTGTEIQAVEPTVVFAGKTLEEGVDYVIIGTVDYTTAGTYTCYIRGIYNYFGTVTCTYTVRMPLGDMNSDQIVDHNDAVYLLLHTMFGEGAYPVEGVFADFDGNGTVDQEDAVYLLLHTLFGEEFYPLSSVNKEN